MSLMHTEQPQKYWLLLDTPDGQMGVNYAEENSLEHYWWYSDTPLSGSLSVSPLWIVLPQEHIETLKEQYPHSIIFKTVAPNEEFIYYIRSITFMLNPNRKPYVIRFYNPKYLTHWLSELEQERRSLLLGPINEIEWCDENHERELLNTYPSYVYQERDKPWFQLTQAEWDLLKKAYKK